VNRKNAGGAGVVVSVVVVAYTITVPLKRVCP
jgi:hypothetical protein